MVYMSRNKPEYFLMYLLRNNYDKYSLSSEQHGTASDTKYGFSLNRVLHRLLCWSNRGILLTGLQDKPDRILYIDRGVAFYGVVFHVFAGTELNADEGAAD